MIDEKKAQVHAFLIALVFIVIFLFVYVIVIPIMEPSVAIYNADVGNNTFNKFLFASLPFMVVIGGIIMSIRGS